MNTHPQILIIDDEPALLEAMTRLLQLTNHEVLEASTGHEGLRLAKENKPDLILIDVVLPDINGIELCRQIKADATFAHTYVVLISGIKTDSEDQAEGLESGADEYIVRPSSNREFLARVQTILRLKQIEDELRQYRDHLEELVAERTAELQRVNEHLHQEITDRKQAEEQLRLLSSAVEQSSEGIALVDLEGNLLFVNEAFAAMHGYNSQELIGKNLSVFHNPEQIPAVDAANRQIQATGEFSGEIWHTRRDGSVFPGLMHNSLLRDNVGNTVGMIGTLRDITDRKRTEEALQESEKRYHAIVEDQTELICRFLRDGTLTFVNKAYCQYFNKKQDALLGFTFLPLIPEEDQAKPQTLLASLSLENPVGTLEHRVIKPNGEIGWQQWTNRAIFDEHECLIEFQAVGRDITDRKRAEEELRRLNQELQELNASKDKFFAIIAHDLKNPFIAFQDFVSAFTRSLQQREYDQMQYLTELLQERVDNLSVLLENLLTWARLERGTLVQHPNRFELWVSVARTFELLTPMAEQKQITLKHSIPEGMAVYADFDAVETVLRNLISNALKFTHPGGTVAVSARPVEQYVEVSVADTGIGISAKGLANVFRIDEEYRRVGTVGERGTGLGLILCQEFVECNGGKIWAESEIGIGSTFHFTLPGSEQ